MSPQDLLKLMNHIRVWLPKGSHIRNEVENIIKQLRAQLGMPPEMTE
jgi:hypothetical protein